MARVGIPYKLALIRWSCIDGICLPGAYKSICRKKQSQIRNGVNTERTGNDHFVALQTNTRAQPSASRRVTPEGNFKSKPYGVFARG
jgi:uncharacterized protein YigE (DUF2233 family)